MSLYLTLLILPVVLGVIGWLYSLKAKNVTIVDSLWAVFICLCAYTAAFIAPGDLGGRGWLVLGMVTAWMLRLSGYLTWRNHGQTEDRRYQAIRHNNQPFALKSLYIIFGLQVVLAWVVAMPVSYTVLHDAAPLGVTGWLGVLLWAFGWVFETVDDGQLARFKVRMQNKGLVLNTGLWRYSRHPNYFGEFCVWWGFYLVAVDAGGWWTVLSPVLMAVLLLRVSGVAMMERSMTTNRPDYADYIKHTNAFFPWRPRG